MSTTESIPDARTSRFPVAGMTCQACAHSVERALARVPGVRRAEVSFGSRSALVEHEEELEPDRLREAVQAAGYTVPADAGELGRDLEGDLRFAEEAEERELARLRRDTLLAFASGTIVVLAHPLGALGAPTWLAPLAASVSYLGAGRGVLLDGLRAARRRSPDMNTLVALGVTAAWSAGLLAPLAPGVFGEPGPHLHAVAMILAFVLLGRWLENRARARAGGAVRALLDLTPPVARVLRRGVETEVSLTDVRPGNLVLVRPGERVPVDGTIQDGESELDESLLTGEPLPRRRRPGERVHAGTINGLGALAVQATGIGEQSALGRIARAVHAAQGSRAPVQQLADRVSAVFTPVVLGIAALALAVNLLAGAGWESSLARLVAVLVVACPCALGLATPTAIQAATDRAAREGLLVRRAGVFEELAAVDVVAFDKTGTLTQGKPRLVAVERVEGAPPEEELLALAAAIETASEQPLARAVVQAARERRLDLSPVQGFRADPGRGVEGTVGGRRVRIESPSAWRGRDSGDTEVSERLEAEEKRPTTTAVLSLDGRATALLRFSDELRPESGRTVAALVELGLEPRLLSGDRPEVARLVAKDLGIDRAEGGLSPEDKQARIRDWQDRGARVAMIGDGINDAVALGEARVGLGMGGGADVAVEASDGAILGDDLGLLPLAIRLARRTHATIRQNLGWAFAYNVVALPLAAGALAPWTGWSMPPAWAALAMAGSSVLVVANSLRLRRSHLR